MTPRDLLSPEDLTKLDEFIGQNANLMLLSKCLSLEEVHERDSPVEAVAKEVDSFLTRVDQRLNEDVNVVCCVLGRLLDQGQLELDSAIEWLQFIFDQISFLTNHNWTAIEFSQGGEGQPGDLQTGFNDNLTWMAFAKLFEVNGH